MPSYNTTRSRWWFYPSFLVGRYVYQNVPSWDWVLFGCRGIICWTFACSWKWYKNDVMINLSVCLSIRVSICQCVCLSVLFYLSVYLFIWFVCLFVCLSISLFVCLSCSSLPSETWCEISQQAVDIRQHLLADETDARSVRSSVVHTGTVKCVCSDRQTDRCAVCSDQSQTSSQTQNSKYLETTSMNT